MRVVSVNVGLPREVSWRGETVTTGIFKQPVAGAVRVRGVSLDGDGQADLTVHGGPDKAVYVYPTEHYPYWHEELGRDLPWGAFGENLTVEGMPLEDAIGVGARLRVGSAELVVTKPRLPCFKLGIRFEDPQMVRRFLMAGRTGYYLRILVPGVVAAGDEVVLIDRDPVRVPISEITRLYAHDQDDIDGIRRLLSAAALPEDWRSFFEQVAAAGSSRTSRR